MRDILLELLGYDDIALQLVKSLVEEEAADEKLSMIAEREINRAALEAGAEIAGD